MRIPSLVYLLQSKSVNTKRQEMKSSKKIEVYSKSSLVSLKAELSKKKEEARLAKHKAQSETIVPTPVPRKVTEFSKKNQGVDERNQKDAEEIRLEEASHKKSRAALEEKAKLYDKLSQGKLDSDADNRYLVNFDQKILEDSVDPNERNEVSTEDEEESIHSDDYDRPSDPEDDWVEYKDCLGRTRRCLRRDLDFIKNKDHKLAESLGMGEPEKEKKPASEPETVTSEEKVELMSEDMRREELRKKWEQQEEELKGKSSVHYQDVLFDEVRTHGVAYYAFSREEKARQAEQEELLKLRNETLKGQTAASELRERRKEQMAARLKAARARKRAREGLPPEPEESEQDPDQVGIADEALSMWPDCKVAEEAKAEDQEIERRRAKIEEDEVRRKKRLEKRPPPVRPWDLGKEGVSGTADPMTQDEWVKKKREERHAEFAPTSELIQTNLTIPEYEYSQKAFPERYKMQKNPFSSKNKAGPSRTSYSHGDYINKDNMPSSSSFEEIDSNTSSRKRAEIPPPATFEYYGPTSSKQKYKKTGEGSNQTSLDEAITAGLHYLRQQAEEREKQKEKGLLGII